MCESAINIEKHIPQGGFMTPMLDDNSCMGQFFCICEGLLHHAVSSFTANIYYAKVKHDLAIGSAILINICY